MQSRAHELGEEARARAEQKREFRETNLRADGNRPDESQLKKLDGSVKKNTAFVKKLVRQPQQLRLHGSQSEDSCPPPPADLDGAATDISEF